MSWGNAANIQRYSTVTSVYLLPSAVNLPAVILNYFDQVRLALFPDTGNEVLAKKKKKIEIQQTN